MPTPGDIVGNLAVQLKATNEALWDIEDENPRFERRGTFDAAFVHMARQVYKTNDKRAALKREINRQLDADIVEVKAYAAY